MRRIVLITVMYFIFLTSLSGQIAQFGGPNRNNVYNETELLDLWPAEGPELVATISGIGDGFGSPAINENGIYIAGMIDSIGYVFHFDHHCKLKWKTMIGREFTYKYLGSRGTPTVEGNRLYYVAAFGDAVCLNAQTGEKIWHVNIQATFNGPEIKWGYTESPLIYNEKIFFTPGGPHKNFVALNKADGKLLWSLDLDSTVNSFCSPAIITHHSRDRILLNTSNYILLLDPDNGNILVKHPLTESHLNHPFPPKYFNGKLFYSSGYGEGATLFQIVEGRKELDTIYTNKDFDSKLSGMIIYNGTVFGTSDNSKRWIGVDLETGNTVFTSRTFKPGSFIQSDGKFYLYSDVGEVALAKPIGKGFEIISIFKIPVKKAVCAFSHPVIYNGCLFIRYNSDLWLYKIK